MSEFFETILGFFLGNGIFDTVTKNTRSHVENTVLVFFQEYLV